MDSKRALAVDGRRVLGAAVVVFTVSACSIVPTRGPITPEQHQISAGKLSQPHVRVIAEPPRPGATPKQIVDGFRVAMANFDDDHKLARQYLAEPLASSWDPRAGATVFEEKQLTGAEDPAKGRRPSSDQRDVTLQGTTLGTLGPDGRYQAADAPGGSAGGKVGGKRERISSQTFGLVRVGGEWRINRVPHQGLLLTAEDFARAYQQVDLFFFDRAQDVLVTDPVHLPIRPGEDRAAAVVRRLLKGPTDWLRGAAVSGIPDGTRLSELLVDDANKIRVNLTAEAAEAETNAERLRALAAQLAWTIQTNLPEIKQVSILIGGVVVAVNNSSIVQRDQFGDFDPAGIKATAHGYYVAKDGRLHGITDGKGQAVPIAPGAPRRKLVQPALRSDEQALAWLDGKSRVVVGDLKGQVQARTWLTGTDFTAPSWDRDGKVWAVDRLGGGRSRVMRGTAQGPLPVLAPELENTHVKELRVSRDGCRAAVIYEEGGETHVKIGVITRDGDTVQLGRLRPLGIPDEAKVTDVAWQDGGHLLVLKGERSGAELLRVPIAGPDFVRITPVSSIDGIAAASKDSILANTDNGKILLYDGQTQTWSTDLGVGDYPMFPLG
ncbi:LpqB family beta-propeller domain-containing protein [Bailinhaonella thermotolerans]|uniref:GerMN domain-containing protein n=1 Tax=Bailinhaonella thermotolerans TaxID=1070861 RepID=A0A3A4AX10_9ACTN|nr:LpqB family beta-propeller domain-containing protein [Bailinhaonella thermotolerans]RJL30457.1 hypothetical protein D5H75_23100 [Bailinhaonella thermotolerans]